MDLKSFNIRYIFVHQVLRYGISMLFRDRMSSNEWEICEVYIGRGHIEILVDEQKLLPQKKEHIFGSLSRAVTSSANKRKWSFIRRELGIWSLKMAKNETETDREREKTEIKKIRYDDGYKRCHTNHKWICMFIEHMAHELAN